jgi:hypothetical protein
MLLNNFYAYLVCKDNFEDFKLTIDSIFELINNDELRLIICDSSQDDLVPQFLAEKGIFDKCIFSRMLPEGIYPAMNFLLDRINLNDYVWYLNPGDVLINKENLLKLFHEIETGGFSWGFGQAVPLHSIHSEAFPKELGENFFESIYSGAVQISHQAMVVRNSALNQIGNFSLKYKICADYFMQLKLAGVFEPYFLPLRLIAFDTSGVSHQQLTRTYLESFLVRFEIDNYKLFHAFSTTLRNLMVHVFKKVYP